MTSYTIAQHYKNNKGTNWYFILEDGIETVKVCGKKDRKCNH